jgi:hypothetical protein
MQQHPGFLEDMDDETASLIFRLQLEDSAQLEATSKGKGPAGKLPDAEIALQLYKKELENTSALVRDHWIASCLDPHGWQTDMILRALPPRPERPATPGPQAVEGEVTPVVPGPEPEPEPELEPEPDPEIERTQCTSCIDMVDVTLVAKTPCGHDYCQDCLQNLFNRSFIDEELFPPRCCRQPILPEGVQAVLTPEIAETYQAKKVEFESTNRTYCSNPTCSIFLPPGMIIREGVAECTSCQTQTCTLCKTAAHDGDCPDDENSRLLRELAQQEGWQSCPGCHRMVELTVGCYHMTLVLAFYCLLFANSCRCLCRVHFCYLCQATPWKSCTCPQWDENRLMNRAAEAVNAQNGGARAARPPALRDVLGMAEQLAGRHNCQHTHFRSLPGSHECQMCHERMPEWVYDCQQCHLQVCRRCRRNRL